MSTRSVTVTIKSVCGTPVVHGPFLVQISAGDTWIPPQPLAYPPPGQKDTKIEDVANDVHRAMTQASQQKGANVSNVGKVESSGVGKKGAQFKISFHGKHEVNIGVCKGDGATKAEPQIEVDAEVEAGPLHFLVKVISALRLYAAGPGWDKRRKRYRGGSRGWHGKTPGQVPHKTLRVDPWKLGFASTSCKKRTWFPGKGSVRRAPARETSTCSIAPHAGGDMEAWALGSILADAAFVIDVPELAPVEGGQPQAYHYYAEGFYYPQDLMTSQNGAMARITYMGLTPGLRIVPEAQETDATIGAATDELRRLVPANPNESFAEVRELIPVVRGAAETLGSPPGAFPAGGRQTGLPESASTDQTGFTPQSAVPPGLRHPFEESARADEEYW